jgi:hypothetical protein
VTTRRRATGGAGAAGGAPIPAPVPVGSNLPFFGTGREVAVVAGAELEDEGVTGPAGTTGIPAGPPGVDGSFVSVPEGGSTGGTPAPPVTGGFVGGGGMVVGSVATGPLGPTGGTGRPVPVVGTPVGVGGTVVSVPLVPVGGNAVGGSLGLPQVAVGQPHCCAWGAGAWFSSL